MIPRSPPRRSSWQIPTIVILYALIVLLGYFYYKLGKRELIRQEHEKLNALADLEAAQLHNWLSEKKKNAALSVEGVTAITVNP